MSFLGIVDEPLTGLQICFYSLIFFFLQTIIKFVWYVGIKKRAFELYEKSMPTEKCNSCKKVKCSDFKAGHLSLS